ncbi:MAG: hypothetical protein QW083_01700, partial [Methanomassiliicoccales archaeon]
MRKRSSNGKIRANARLITAGRTVMHRAQKPMMIQKMFALKMAYSVARKIRIANAHETAVWRR